MSEDVADFKLPAFAPEPPKPAPEKRRKQQNLIVDVSMLDEGLPANIDAEKTILGAILLDEDAYYEASERLLADDFCLDSHKRIYTRMRELINNQLSIDIVTLANELSRNKEIEYVGGVAYLASLTEGLPMRPVISDYIAIVKDKSMARKLMIVCSASITRAADQSESALVIAGALGTQLEEVVSGGLERGLEPISKIHVEVMNKFVQQSELESTPGFSWGVPGIDEATGGIQDGEQAVVGCYSGVGKTTLMAQMVAANCPKGRACAMFLIEPTRHTFLRQLWTIVAGVRYTAATKPWLASGEEKARIRWASEQVLEWDNLYIFDKSDLTLDEQIAHARLAMHRHKVQLYGIDYIQRMTIAPADKHEDTRLRIGRASIGNANLVKDTNCRSIILSQLNRSGSLDTLPTMNMLRESGQLENDATTILLLHLKYDAEQGHFTDEGAGIICKQRFGVPCNVKLYKDARTAKWCSGEKPKDGESDERQLWQN